MLIEIYFTVVTAAYYCLHFQKPLISVCSNLPLMKSCSQRDGMNLVSYEYVACQSDNAGVLVLSEFAGVCN
jgi:trehalose-6-phosphate synthase